ncbi:LysE family translocator [Bordetella genomosp. 13]|uniref:RhtB family transporter n=1 Tax=Bordetella genomosp. 13 TaxID=463040 RepID=A0A1W6ZJF9_9BORD|nr:LysE family translocator [Bordetella genomosp. 13]ARP97290.1 RhtB family transporter [Bordetella genomosp. 13]
MSFLAFLFAAVLLAITPGPGLAYVVARTATGGRREGLASLLGTSLGGMVHVAASALGLSLVIAQSAVAFSVVKYVGAAYLVYLGIGLLRRSGEHVQAPRVAARGARRAFLDGILVEAMNVKTALFFLAFLPQFIAPGHALAPQLAGLGTVCVAMNATSAAIAVFVADRLLRSSTVRAARARLMNRISGCTMLGLAAYLALTRRTA